VQEVPADGMLHGVVCAECEMLQVGQVLSRIATSGAAEAADLSPSAPPGHLPAGGDVGARRASPASAEEGLSPFRRRIAERTLEARATIPQGACVREVDLSAVSRDGRSWSAVFREAVA